MYQARFPGLVYGPFAEYSKWIGLTTVVIDCSSSLLNIASHWHLSISRGHGSMHLGSQQTVVAQHLFLPPKHRHVTARCCFLCFTAVLRRRWSVLSREQDWEEFLFSFGDDCCPYSSSPLSTLSTLFTEKQELILLNILPERSWIQCRTVFGFSVPDYSLRVYS